MKLPKVITKLVEAQNQADSVAYANCFSETATVFDEGKTYKGKTDIEQWIANANENYKAVMQPLHFEEKETTSILKAEVSGIFPGSPVVLNYHLEIADGHIQSLKITT
ncbi:nuclear transport factor 2 family protein [Olivibacter sp. SA151]|uniref:nuclear transport factor 2 family protein n=1 Tax=Olivibacter jilunii TaxID=985016 RepID=UPI003F181BA1